MRTGRQAAGGRRKHHTGEEAGICLRTSADPLEKTIRILCRTVNQFAEACCEDGGGKQLEAVKPMLEKALADEQEVLGEDHPIMLAAMHMLCMSCLAAGETDRARRLIERVHAIQCMEPGENDPVTEQTAETAELMKREHAGRRIV